MFSSELSNWNEYLKMLVGLLAITRPIAVIPTYLAVTARYRDMEKWQVAVTTSVTVLLTLMGFTFFGTTILLLFGISLSTFRIAGGILLLITALGMLRSSGPALAPAAEHTRSSIATVGVVPLAIPLLAGPETISTVILFGSIHDSLGHQLLISAVIVTVTLIVFGVLRAANRASKYIGETSMLVFNRIMGLIIAAIAVEFILNGLDMYFPSLPS